MAEPASTLTSRLSSNQPTRFLISDLFALLETYLEPEQIRDVYRAYLFSAEAHEGQVRLTGEPYIYHPLAPAQSDCRSVPSNLQR